MRVTLDLILMKRYKAIFGNPPYSIKTGTNRKTNRYYGINLAFYQGNVAEEVYYVTPLIWNGKAKSFVQHVYDDIGKIDLEINDYFRPGLAFVIGNTHKPDKLTIHTKSDVIEMDNIRDIKYIPFDFNNTLSIHMKGWRKKSLEIYRNRNRLLFFKENVSSPLIKRVQDDEYKYPVFSTNIYNLYYTNEEGLKECKQDLVPKVLIGGVETIRRFLTGMASILPPTMLFTYLIRWIIWRFVISKWKASWRSSGLKLDEKRWEVSNAVFVHKFLTPS